MTKYSIQDKNRIFARVQEYIEKGKLTMQNMVDLHDILTVEKPSYSQNKNGTMYMSTKYSDETFEKIEELLKWVDKQILLNNPIEEEMDNGNGNGNIDDENNDVNKSFGKGKMFKNTFGLVRYKSQKPEDLSKKNETFKRITKKTKKRSIIPIHHQEKGITSWESSFNITKNSHFTEYYISRELGDDEDEDIDVLEDEDEDFVELNQEDEQFFEGNEDEDEDEDERDEDYIDDERDEDEDDESVGDVDDDDD